MARLAMLFGVGCETTTTLNDWTLPLRRRADDFLKEGRFEEAADLLARIRQLYRHNEQPKGGNPQGGSHDPDHPERRGPDLGRHYARA